jgi:hypothetical protein
MVPRSGGFRQQDVTRALRAAREAGLEVSSYEVDLVAGKITVMTNSERQPASDLDKWLASHES